MSEPIKRYECYAYESLHYNPVPQADMREASEGEYVLHADHLAARAEDAETIARLIDVLKRIEYLTRTLMSKDGIINSISRIARQALK